MSMCSLLSLTRGHRGRSLVINARNKLLPLVVVKEPRQAVTAFSALVRASNTGPTTAHNPPRWTLFSSTPNNDGEYGSLLIDRVSSQKRFFRREKDGQSTATTTSISSSTHIHGAYSSSSSSSILEVEPMERRRMYQYLQLQSFSKEELENVYQTILSAAPDTADSTKRSNDKSDALHIAHIRQFLWNRMLDIEAEFEANKHQQYQAGTQGDSHAAEHYKNDRFQYAHEEALRFRKVFPVCNADDNQQGKPQIQIEQDLPGLTKKEFVQTIIDGATALDVGRMWPITLSILLVGTSVGIVTPAMPFVVEKIGLTPGQYGTVVSAFALAKILCNVPSAILVERHGRKVRKRTISLLYDGLILSYIVLLWFYIMYT